MPDFTYNNIKINYSVVGSGKPLLLLYGNTASVKILKGILFFFKDQYQLILPELPGHGKSSRLVKFPVDFWYETACVMSALLKELKVGPCSVIGTSEGALVALNMALEFPESVRKVVADCFEGETAGERYATIFDERNKSKKMLGVKYFWFNMHGFSWKKVVDADTVMLHEHYLNIRKYFHKDLSEIKCPVMLTGTKKDYFIPDMEDILSSIHNKINKSKLLILNEGGHTALLTVPHLLVPEINKFLAE